MTKRAILLLGWLTACGSDAPPPAELTEDAVAAVVNGRPITEPEVELAQMVGGPGGERLDRAQAIDQLVDLELEAQAAEAAGLHEDPRFQKVAQRIRTEASTAYRDRLAKHFRMDQLANLPEIPEAESRAWFDANQDQLRAEFRVRQVVTRSLADAERAAASLKAGSPWEEVQKAFSGEASEPPPIRFDRLSPGWWEALSELAPGEASDPVNLIGDRYIVFQLVERRDVEAPSFEDVSRQITALLQANWLADQRASGRAERREAARIEIVPDE